MGDMADYALDQLSDEDEEQLRVLGTSNVFSKNISPLSEHDQWLIEEGEDVTR